MNILLITIGLLTAFILFSLIKKLIKLMFFAVILLAIAAGGYWFLNNDQTSIVPEETKQKAENLKTEGLQKIQNASQQLQESTSDEIKNGVNAVLTETKETLKEGIQKVTEKPSQPDPTRTEESEKSSEEAK